MLLKAVEYIPGNLFARIRLAEIYLSEGAAELALEQLKVVLARQPGNDQAHVLKGNAYLLKREPERARQAYRKAVEFSPDNPAAYYHLARLDRLHDRFDQAMAHLDKVLSLKTDHVPAVATKVSIYMDKKQPAKALSFLENKLREHEKNTQLAARFHAMRGTILFSQKDYDQSEMAFKKTLDLNPDMVSPYLSLAKLYLAKKETTKAISVYMEILEKQPNLIKAYMALGVIYEAEDNQTEARNMYEKALKINRNFAPAANNLAWMLLKQGEDPDLALNLAKTAKAQLPDDPSVADTLGLALLAKGLYPSAVSELIDAAEKMPRNPTVLYHLGLAHWKNGDRDQALAALHDALEIKDAFPERQEAKELLEEITRPRS